MPPLPQKIVNINHRVCDQWEVFKKTPFNKHCVMKPDRNLPHSKCEIMKKNTWIFRQRKTKAKKHSVVVGASCEYYVTPFFCVCACVGVVCFLLTPSAVGPQPQQESAEVSVPETLDCPGLTSSAKQLWSTKQPHVYFGGGLTPKTSGSLTGPSRFLCDCRGTCQFLKAP